MQSPIQFPPPPYPPSPPWLPVSAQYYSGPLNLANSPDCQLADNLTVSAGANLVGVA